jgi:hypothetical protein
VAVETGLGSAVAPALAVIVYGEVEIHDFAFELDEREGVRGHGDRERKKEVLCGGWRWRWFHMGGRDIKYLSNEEKIWITSGIDSSTDRLALLHESGLCVTRPCTECLPVSAVT